MLLYETDAYRRTLETVVREVCPEGVVLEATIFYPQGGGQPGDTGVLVDAAGRRVRVVDTRRDAASPQRILHVTETAPDWTPGTPVVAEIDWERRYRHMRMHTALHLMCAVIGAPVTGCSIAADKGRLDFDLPEPTLDKEAVTLRLAEIVAQDVAVTPRTVAAGTPQDLAGLVWSKSVAPPLSVDGVRVVDIAGVDAQACGGTHVARTGEVGALRCVKIEKKSRHNRRFILELA